jgi:predicted ATPase
LIGRDQDLLRVREALLSDQVRLLTLSGIGGIGKTRLAVEVATTLRAEIADGARFVDLAQCRDTSAVLSAISSAIDLRHTGRRPLVDALKRRLQRLEMLLVLDNFEQVLSAAWVVGELLATCPALKILATSRAPLRISWEHEYPVQPLELPDPAAANQSEVLLRCPAVSMLIERMTAAGLSATLARAEAQPLAEICARLGGIPLAIELAAARVRVLPPRVLLDRLSRPLELLTSGARDHADRHQTLRRTFDWSFELLATSDQVLFAQLGVFVGGFTIEAAESVCNALSAPGIDVLDALSRLVESSLVRSVPQAGSTQPRLALLEPVREYALDRLDFGAGTPGGARPARALLCGARGARPERI